jgi:glycosyltransferase involved in cell wall biosynthesis
VRVAFHGDGYARRLGESRGFPLVDLPPIGTRPEQQRKDGFRLGNGTSFALCRRVIRQHAASFVHVNDKRMIRTWGLPAGLTRTTLIAHWRSIYSPSWSVDIGLRAASRIVCVSQYSKNLLPDWAQAKSEVVYNPFGEVLKDADLSRVRRRIRESAGIPIHAAVVGFFGALTRRKRPHVLLDILERIPETSDGRPVYGIVCGQALEPRDEVYFERRAAAGSRLIAPGYVANPLDWMAASDVMVAPAVEEPLARVAIEGQLAGLPVIVSSDGGLREVIEDGVSGLITKPWDRDGWIVNVKRVLDDPSFAARLREGGRLASANLTIGKHVDTIERVYRECSKVSRVESSVLPNRKAV